ncbi:MAG: hypothetical protein KDA24_04700 [Deltaproteobacteria bacterium]|nr:hypothetical protein [Deltaproteobacteria bacterium]
MRQTTWVLSLLLLLALSGCGIGLQPVPGAAVPDDDDVANDDDDDSAVTDDDDATGDDDDDDATGDDDDSTTSDDDDSTTGDDDDATGSGGACTALTQLSCGDSISANTNDPGSTNAIDTWGCTGWANTGPEIAYEFSTTSAGTVTVTLASIETGQDLDVYVTSDSGIGCHEADCIAAGDVDADFEASPGISYFVVVDGYQGSAGDFVLEVDCAVTGDDDDATGDDDDSVGDDDDATGAVESCGNGVDDDLDGLVDCDDSDCAADPACAAPVESCLNGLDDDGDGLVDCDDSDCAADPACVPPPVENCSNGLDDDGNGLVDCDDAACAADPACQGGSGGGACTPDWTLTEGMTDSWNNGGAGSTNNVALYGCIAWDESGPEYTYSYTAAATGTATVDLSVTGWLNFSDLDVFVLDGSAASCDPLNCVAYGDSTASWAVTAGSTWFIVVDGFLGDTSNYDLELTFQ